MRFSGFEGEWEKKELGEVCTKINKKTNGEKYKLMSITSGFGLISQHEKFGREIAGNSYSNYIVIEKDDFAYNKSSTKLFPEGEIAIYKGEEKGAVPNSIFICFRFDTSKIQTSFAKFLFDKNVHGDWLRNFIAVGARAHGALQIKEEDLFATPLFLPAKKEQQKVALFLSLIDERIQSQMKIITQLETLMRGLQEQIFLQKLRFKDENGNEFVSWKEKMLGEIATITTGSSNREDSILDGEYLFFDRSQDVRTSNRFLFDKEAVIVPGEGQSFVAKYYKGKFDLHQRTYAIFDFLEVNGKFLFYNILFKDIYLQSIAVGSTVKSLRLPMFQNMPIRLPCLKEQSKIANFLTSINQKIDTERQLLNQYQNQKKFLLQNLFI